MQFLNKKEKLPGILFLDLNMPCKNGFTCLTEIKQDEELRELPVVILSTSFQQEKVDQLHKGGAQHYVCKPTEFSHLKNLIHRAISKPPEEGFVLSNEI
jgi:CheY-like chemotaxis protein